MKLGIASDHGGFELKEYLIQQLPDLGLINLGTFTNQRVDYPLFDDQLCKQILNQTLDKGILICGTGIGISMRANRYPGIRAALIYNDFTAQMASAHNNANVICLGGRTTRPADALLLIKEWLNTPFESGRHTNRITLIDAKTS